MKKITVLFLTLLAVCGVVSISAANDCYNCCTNCYSPARYCATFVSDVTIPDGSYVQPGSNFTKTWRIRNNGNTTWNSNYKLVYYSGSQMSAPQYVSLPYSVAPGQTVDITVPMVAPAGNGTYKGNWMFQADNGQLFGVGYNCYTPIWVQITTTVPTYNPNPCWGYNCNPRPWNPGPPPFEPQKPWNPGPRPNPQPNPRPNPHHRR